MNIKAIDYAGRERWLVRKMAAGIELVLRGDVVPDISGKLYKIDWAKGPACPVSYGVVYVSTHRGLWQSIPVAEPLCLSQFPMLRWS